MISRERVQMALNHQESDRVPIDFGGLAMMSMHLETYKKVLDYFGIQEEIKLVDQFQRSVKISKEVINKLHGDTWSVGPKWKPWKESKVQNRTHSLCNIQSCRWSPGMKVLDSAYCNRHG